MASNALILYGKYNKDDSRSTHCIKIDNSTTIKKNSFDTRKCTAPLSLDLNRTIAQH